jgi:hypothetical protein
MSAILLEGLDDADLEKTPVAPSGTIADLTISAEPEIVDSKKHAPAVTQFLSVKLLIKTVYGEDKKLAAALKDTEVDHIVPIPSKGYKESISRKGYAMIKDNFIDFIEACGLTLAEVKKGKEITAKMVGRTFKASLGPDEYNGQVSTRIKAFLGKA